MSGGGAYKRQIAGAIRGLMYDKTKTNLFICDVTAVDEDAKTCEALAKTGDSELGIPSIKLNTEANDGFCLVPAIGSSVLVVMTENKEFYVISCEDIEKVLITIDKDNFVVFDKDGWVFNEGNNGGLILIAKLLEKINQLENAFNGHMHPTAVPGPPSIPTPNPALKIPITPTQRIELENTKIKH